MSDALRPFLNTDVLYHDFLGFVLKVGQFDTALYNVFLYFDNIFLTHLFCSDLAAHFTLEFIVSFEDYVLLVGVF